jgi:hypothetical protein
VCPFAALAFVSASPALGAEPIPIADAVAVDGPECVDRKALVGDLAVWLGRDTLDPRIRISVHNEGDHSVTFEILRDGQPIGERRLGGEGMGCARLRAVDGLAVASALDATLLASLGRASPALAPPEEPRPAAPRKAPPLVVEGDKLSVAADGLLLIGVLPVAVFGGELSVGYRLSSWFEPRIAFLGTASESFALGNAATDAYLFAGRGEACLLRGGSVLRGRACVGLAAGVIPAEGSGLATNYTVDRPWAAASARLEAEVRIAPALRLVVGTDGLVPFVAPTFEAVGVNGAAAAQRSISPIGLVVRVGVVFAFL